MEKTKRITILFVAKHKLWNAKSLKIVYNAVEIKQHAKAKYQGCILDESLSGELMTLNVIDETNSSARFLYRQHRFLTPTLSWFLCNEMIQPLFGHVCTAWFQNISKNLRLRFQATLNISIRFCLQLDKMSGICAKDLLELILVFMRDTYNSLYLIFSKFYNNQSPVYFN